MSRLQNILTGLASLFRKKRLDRELHEELTGFLEMAAQEKKRQGLSHQEALRALRLEHGTVDSAAQLVWSARWESFLETCWQDLRFATRILRKSPAFTAAVVLTLALGIGGASAVFSVVDGILFRSLPYPQDDRLVSFGLLAPIERDEFMLGSSYVDFRKQSGPFQSVTSMSPGVIGCDLTEQNALRLSCAHVEQTFLPTLGIQLLLGRNFNPDEDRPNALPVALLSYSLWKSRFASSPGVLAETLSLDGMPTRIIGVLPSTFEMPTLSPVDILLPQALDETLQRRASPGAVLRTFARLKPGLNVPNAVAALQPWFAQAVAGAPPEFRKEVHLSVRTLRDRQIQDVRLASWLLLGSVLAFLLVACTNVANLLLARATARHTEVAVRAALGAGKARLIRQTLTESGLFGILGAAVGSGFAYLLLRLLVSIAPQGVPRLDQARLDLRVVLFTLAITLFSALLFGVAPALQLPSSDALIGKEVRATPRNFLRQIFVSAQIAISLILLTGATLLLRSLWNLQNIPLGMQTENILVENLSLPRYRYPSLEKQLAFFTELEDRLKRLPGVISVAFSDSLPPSGRMRSTILAAIEVAGHPFVIEGTGGPVGWRAVTPGYFSALGIPVIHGRAFVPTDLLPGENTIILNETLARELFPTGNPLGQQLRLFRTPGPWRTVVGVAADVKNDGLAIQPGPEFYLPSKNDPVQSFSEGYLVVRTQMHPAAVAAWIRSETSELDSTLPANIGLLRNRVDKLTAGPRFNATLLSLFAALGVLLAAIGIYGVARFFVEQRTREIGVRIALGATPRSILHIVLASVAKWTIIGSALGLLGAWASARLLRSLLFEVQPHDPAVFAVALFVLTMVVFAAAWIPARRATRIDPIAALRYE